MDTQPNVMAMDSINQTPSYNQPQHLYASAPQHLPSTYPTHSSVVGAEALAAGMMGLVIVGTGTMGANLHRVQEGDITIGEALNDSMAKGATAGVTAASATVVSKTLTSGGLVGLGVTLAVATGVSYLLNK